MSSPVQRIAPATPRGLLDPWRTWAGTLGMAAFMYACCVLLWWALTGFSAGRLVRTGPWELMFFALGSLSLHAAIHAARGLWPDEPRLLPVLAGVVVVALVLLLIGVQFQRLTPDWVYPGKLKAVHAANGWLLAMVLSPLWFTLILLFLDMRLSALEPQREARLRAEAVARRAERDAAPQNRVRRAWRSFWRMVSWQQALDSQSRPLDVFTWPRVIVRSFIDALVVTTLFGLLVTLLIALGLFGDIAEVAKRWEEYEKLNTTWVDWLLGFAMVGAGVWVLGLARMFAPWMNHAVNAAIVLVLMAHICVVVLSALSVNRIPGMDWFYYLSNFLTILCALPPIQLILSRTRAIDAEQRSAAERDRLAAESQRTLAIADLKALQAQIEPHFLYNTLANLQLLIRQDTAKADAMTGHLIDYLRARLPAMRSPTTTLAQELDMVASYLALLQVRMGSRLQFTVDLPAACAEAQVPPLSVMTLVENAIKHGLEPKRGGGRVAVSAQTRAGWLVVEVQDTGMGLGASVSVGSGIGLGNVRERLRLMHSGASDEHGQPARVDLQAHPSGGTVASLHLPLITTAAEVVL